MLTRNPARLIPANGPVWPGPTTDRTRLRLRRSPPNSPPGRALPRWAMRRKLSWSLPRPTSRSCPCRPKSLPSPRPTSPEPGTQVLRARRQGPGRWVHPRPPPSPRRASPRWADPTGGSDRPRSRSPGIPRSRRTARPTRRHLPPSLRRRQPTPRRRVTPGPLRRKQQRQRRARRPGCPGQPIRPRRRRGRSKRPRRRQRPGRARPLG
jgi:hypothetical protein